MVRRRAEELGVSLEQYLLDALTRDLDPDESAREYVEVVRNLVEQAREELSKGDLRQARRSGMHAP